MDKTKVPQRDFGTSEIEILLRKLGIEAVDSDFMALQQEVLHALRHGTDHEFTMQKHWEDPIIRDIVLPGQSVVDLGCGDGELLVRLAFERGVKVQGIDHSEDAVVRCMERGIPVCHEDLDKALLDFPDNCFDYAVLEKTLQTLQNPLEVLESMMRVARYCFVSFPNFAHWSIRMALSYSGRMPITGTLPYNWYDTPNIHLCSITDFLKWIETDGVQLHDSWVVVADKILPYDPKQNHNIKGEQAMFLISRGQGKRS